MKLVLSLVSLVFLFSSSSFAERGSGPCKADAEKFCKDVKPGGGKMRDCLREHKDELSSECKARHSMMKEKFKNFREACKEDIKTHCGDVKPGKRKIIQCLKEKESSLSAECKEAVQRKKN
ncbi:MAG: hypothetical protein IPM57_03045 [Oligoflexia bacterium]|nr:hypothetical protein [Oligoflexia bacterium]